MHLKINFKNHSGLFVKFMFCVNAFIYLVPQETQWTSCCTEKVRLLNTVFNKSKF